MNGAARVVSIRGPGVIERLKQRPIGAIAAALGLQVQQPRGAGGGAFGPCPACGREKRNASTPGERRLACGIRADGLGWRCIPCDVSGDGVSLVSYALEGAALKDLDADRKHRVIDWCRAELGDVEPAPGVVPRLRDVPPPAPVKPPEYPPEAEIAAVWDACWPVTEMRDVAEWLRAQRGLDPAAIAAADLARALPGNAPLRAWSMFGGRAWTDLGHRLVVPLVDAGGRVRSLIARFAGAKPGKLKIRGELVEVPKSLPPRQFARKGLVMANGRARRMLERGAFDGDALDAGRVVITEGEMDFLTWSTEPLDAEPTVLGIVQGSWTADAAARIPDGATVLIATDLDADGDKYAATVTASLTGRARAGALEIERWSL